ncbi:MAG: Myo-inositol 2-dehydrogenase [Steroidobacteraceae bacterium]|nr:Myo-inositol 2-dehydrogenase [Steroidobacteraceae bacterium]
MFGFALFGAGRIGQIHARNLAARQDARLRHVVDVSPAAARALADTTGAAVSDAATALADANVQAILIASSTDTHAALIAAGARAGKAIFCEKPLDLDLARAEASIAAAAEANVLLALGFNRRFDPAFRRLQREIAAGRVGKVEVVSITSRDPAPPPPAYVARSGGLFRDMMIHDLDMARWLLGATPGSVYARGGALIDPAIGAAGDIDTAVVVLEGAGGELCQITNSRRCAYGYDQRIEVFGSGGLLRADNVPATTVETADAGGFTREPALPFFLERYAAAYRDELDEFLRALRGEPAALATGEDGRQALRLANAAQRSLETRAPVALSDE